MPTPQGRYWRLTIPFDAMPQMVALKDPLCYIKGQQEIGAEGYHHWQLVAVSNRKITRAQLKACFVPQANVDLTKSAAYNEYVWKDDTAVPGTRFELGRLPISRARTEDWDKIYEDARAGDLENIPKDILIRHYSSIKRIRVDNMEPITRPNIFVKCYYGPTGTGKTHRAWDDQEGEIPYIKNPNTKWWDGYRGQKNVIIDEFNSRIDISYLLTWLDKYPCIVEVKGYSVPLQAVNFWITSNIAPEDWYTNSIPAASEAHRQALRRRLNHIEFMDKPYVQQEDDNDLSSILDELLVFD